MKLSLLFFPTSHYHPLSLCRPVSLKPTRVTSSPSPVSAVNESPDGEGALTARERRQLRQERRGSNTTESNWKEEVEERLILEKKNRRKLKKTRRQKLSVNPLTELGQQWWALRVSRNYSHDTATRLVRSLSQDLPQVQFKVYNPSIIERRNTKDGFLSVKRKPLNRGTMYIHCIMNRTIHDYLIGFKGVHGFTGNEIQSGHDQYFVMPKPVNIEEIEEIMRKEKEEQDKLDNALREKLLRRKKTSQITGVEVNNDEPSNLLPGVSVRVLSGPFAEYIGCIKEVDLKKRKAIIEVMLFGKKSNVDIDFDQIEPVDPS